jgi:tetratricopeptide repeat protein
LQLAATLVAAAISVITSGCRESRPQVPKALAEVDPMPAARDAMGRHDYAAAVPLLRQTLARHSADVEAHYRLAVSTSHLDQLDEASREFEWVVAHAQPDAPEARIAHEWLASRTTVAPPLNAAAPGPSPVTVEPPPQAPDRATLSGRAVGPDGPMSRLQLFLKGLPETAVKDEYHRLRTDAQGNFQFPNLVPGDYMLTNAIAGPVQWRLKVALARGQRLTLDLSPSNDVRARDDFPEKRP